MFHELNFVAKFSSWKSKQWRICDLILTPLYFRYLYFSFGNGTDLEFHTVKQFPKRSRYIFFNLLSFSNLLFSTFFIHQPKLPWRVSRLHCKHSIAGSNPARGYPYPTYLDKVCSILTFKLRYLKKMTKTPNVVWYISMFQSINYNFYYIYNFYITVSIIIIFNVC